ncbi:penicillin acylase family protein [Mucilaginibacter glaciei]|uniref:Penicillin acylase family protein n=1 Tax=Mucilaginibacter glaciei TaxID=2772109 RepID=A0A926NQ86_9SPHI|nr:penicillin acylase family protein [Mucilaginibacter glaciei]MBD1392677.1 penicillin acylase family protein [Mucilaginibacter glaciei]
MISRVPGIRYILNALLIFVPTLLSAQKFSAAEVQRFKQQAAAVTIIRDDYGVPHIYGKMDASVVFGLMYTQCEDNFKGIERNYLYQLGRQSEADGESKLFDDVQLQLIADSAGAIADYNKSPLYFKKLMDAFADGLNYYLYKHPEVKPLVFTRFKPWYALMFTDGSVAATETGDIATRETAAFYNGETEKLGSVYQPRNIKMYNERENGSNGFAIAPEKSASGHAMLYINPHVPFYFRSEVGLKSDEGLQAYGAVTWGQFFIYQGFNSHCGWMHTSSYADVGDVYLEKMTKKDGKWFYEYDGKLKPVVTRPLKLNIKQGDQTLTRNITGYYTHHGPVLAARDGKWLALKHNNRSYNALLESWLITKANTFDQYKKAMGLLSNTSNNTVYADGQGNIAFWYGNFMPRRDPNINWALPVDGSTPVTEWKGVHPLNEIVHIYNPATGWIQNCNSTPYTASGTASPPIGKYPLYMAPDNENYRGLLAARLLKNAGKLSLDGLIAKGYDHYLSLFDDVLPPLFAAYKNAPDSLRAQLAEPIKMLQLWGKRSTANSIATTLAVEYATAIMRVLPAPKAGENTYQVKRVRQLLQTMPGNKMLELLSESVKSLQTRYGTWKMPWGDINRYQRPADGITFDDDKPSLPVGTTSSNFGQLPSFVSRTMNTQKRYGFSGNSFLAAIEFGPKVKAKSIVTGGSSFNPGSRHFTDQAQGYLDGKFKEVLFYKEDVLKHAEKTYHPGQ